MVGSLRPIETKRFLNIIIVHLVEGSVRLSLLQKLMIGQVVDELAVKEIEFGSALGARSITASIPKEALNIFDSSLRRGLLLLHFLHSPITLIDQLLFPFDILEHESTLPRKCDVIRINFGVLGIERKDPRQSLSCFIVPIEPLHVFAEVVVDQVVFEYRYDVPRLVVHDITCQFAIEIVIAF